MAGYKCNVTGSTSTKKIGTAQIAKYCEDDASKCVKGAKQMIAFNRTYMCPHNRSFMVLTLETEKSGNNVEVPDGKTPMYNEAWGWENGKY